MTTIIVCETCGYDAASPDVIRPGRKLYEQLSHALEQRRLCDASYEKIHVQPYTCLMACSRKCTVQIRGDKKIGYTLGDMQSEAENIEGILDYTALYQESDTGAVAYKQWPEVVKGKFIARFPPLDND